MWKQCTFQPIQLNSPVYKLFTQKFTTVVSIMVKTFQVTNHNFFKEQFFLDGEPKEKFDKLKPTCTYKTRKYVAGEIENAKKG